MTNRRFAIEDVVRATAVLVTVFGLCVPAVAASVRPDEGAAYDYSGEAWFVVRIMLVGSIKTGDVGRLESAVATAERRAQRAGWSAATILLQLDSDGGDYEEAVQIIDLIRTRGIGTYIGDGNTCLSACAFVFMAGSNLEDRRTRRPWRFLHVGGDLGFHAPYDPQSKYGFSRGVEAISELFRALGPLSDDLYYNMLRTPSARFYHAETIDQIGKWDIELVGYEVPPIDVAGLWNVCANAFNWIDAEALFAGEVPGSDVNEAFDYGYLTYENSLGSTDTPLTIVERYDAMVDLDLPVFEAQLRLPSTGRLRYGAETQNCQLALVDDMAETPSPLITRRNPAYAQFMAEPEEYSGVTYDMWGRGDVMPPWYLFSRRTPLREIVRTDAEGFGFMFFPIPRVPEY